MDQELPLKIKRRDLSFCPQLQNTKIRNEKRSPDNVSGDVWLSTKSCPFYTQSGSDDSLTNCQDDKIMSNFTEQLLNTEEPLSDTITKE